MDFIEDYKDLFEKVSNLPEDGSNVYFMTPTCGDLENACGNESIDALNDVEYTEPTVETKFKPFQPNKNASYTVSGTENIKVNPIDDTDELGIDDLDQDDQEAFEEMSDDTEMEFNNDANNAMNRFQNNHQTITHSEKRVDTTFKTNNGYETSTSYKEINGEPEFLKVRNIKPVDNINNFTTEKSTVGKGFPKVKSDPSFKEYADAAMDKCTDIVEKMKCMQGKDEHYKRKCAGLLSKYSNLPKTQFESLCNFMEKIN